MAEQELVSLFAILLVLGSVLLLFAPIVYRLMKTGLGALSFLLAFPALLLGIVALSIIDLSLRDPALLAPIVVIVFGARVASPTLAYLKAREKLLATGFWAPLRLGALLGFLAMGIYVGYRAFIEPSGLSTDPLIVSERFLMALGTSFVFLRIHMRLMPKGSANMMFLWGAAILFSIAFALVAPYAFPSYEVVYSISGVMGWLIGGAVVLRSR